MRRMVLGLMLMLGMSFAKPAFAMERQRAMNWCWAAAIQDVLKPHRIHESQESIVFRLNGWLPDRPATIYEVENLVRSYGVRATTVHRPGNVYELASTLERGHQIIALAYPSNGAVGHFIVLEGITPDGVIIADPATGRTSTFPIASLYYQWRWSHSIVVG